MFTRRELDERINFKQKMKAQNYQKEIEQQLIDTYFFYKRKQEEELYSKEVKNKVVRIGESINMKKQISEVEEIKQQKKLEYEMMKFIKDKSKKIGKSLSMIEISSMMDKDITAEDSRRFIEIARETKHCITKLMEKTESSIRTFTKCMINNSLQPLSQPKQIQHKKTIKLSRLIQKEN